MPSPGLELLASLPFSSAQRRRGLELFGSGAVEFVDGDPFEDTLGARVYDRRRKDSPRCHVEVTVDGDDVETMCTCNQPRTCGHVVAALLQYASGRKTPRGRAGARTQSDREAVPAPVHPTPTTPKSPTPQWQQRLTRIRDAARPLPQPVPGATAAITTIFVVGIAETAATSALCLRPLRVERVDGENAIGTAPHDWQPEHFAEADRPLLHLLQSSKDRSETRTDVIALRGPKLATLLPLLFATNRMQTLPKLHGNAGPAKRLQFLDGEPFQCKLEVETTPKATLVHARLVRGESRLSHPDVRALIDGGYAIAGDAMFAVNVGPALSLIRSLLQDGPLSCDPLDARALLTHVLEVASLDPAVSSNVPVRTETPREVVLIARTGQAMAKHVPCEVKFAYGEVFVAEEEPHLLDADADGTLRRRDPSAEVQRLAAFAHRVDDLLLPTGMRTVWLAPKDTLFDVLTQLVERGVHVLADGKSIVRSDTAHLSVATGIDWFDVHGSVEFAGGHQLPLARALLAAKKGDRLVDLGNGQHGLLSDDLLKRLRPLLALGEERIDGVRMQTSQAALLDALLEARSGLAVEFDAGFVAARERVQRWSGLQPAKAPANFAGSLRPYQEVGLGWLHFLREARLGGCLADDMGLGKTVQVLALLARVHADRATTLPSLLVVPLSVLENWSVEAARFAPSLRVATFQGSRRWKEHPPETWCEQDVLLTTYGTLRLDVARMESESIHFEYVVLDEAQAIANAQSLTAKAVRLLRANHRLALSGTPVQNHTGELWSLFDFLVPGMLGRSQTFRDLLASGPNGSDPELIRRAIAPFVLRRTKEQVLPDLPPKQEQTLWCELEGSQRKGYDALREHYRSILLTDDADLDQKERFVALEALLRLRQMACHEALVDPRKKSKASAKLDVLIPRLQELVANGHKVLVFSQFTSFLALVREQLTAHSVPIEELDGSTRNRQQRVDRFQSREGGAVFLISLKAGGFGLNLTAADYVFLLDPWWNPAAEAQAADRAHRIGQTKKVTIYRLIAKDTVEQKVLDLQAKKRDLVKAVMGADQSLLQSMTREDLAQLLG